MPNISLAPIQAKIDELKALGAPQIAPDAWAKLTEDFSHIVAELNAAQADGRLSIIELFGLAKDALTIAGDISALVTQLFPAPAPAPIGAAPVA
jgi:hypothetical protein